MAVEKVAKMRPRSNVVVFGAGPVGLLVMATAKALGAAQIIAVDIIESKLAFAKGYAASGSFLPDKQQDEEVRTVYSRRQAELLKAKFGFTERGSTGVDLVVDCTGSEICIQTGLYVAKHGGTFVQVGMGTDNVVIPISQVLAKELNVKGSFRYGPGCYSMALDLVACGRVALAPIISHRYPFLQAAAAFRANQDGRGKDGKICIKIIVDGPI